MTGARRPGLARRRAAAILAAGAVAVGLLAACGPDRAPVVPAARVLVLAPPGSLSVTLAGEAIAQRNREHPPAEALELELREVRSAAEATEAVRAAFARSDRYRAVFSPSQTFARAAQLVVADRPIVFDGIDDPVANCLVDTLRRPGRNATGYMHLLPDTEQKMIELLHDGFPSLQEVLMLVSGHNVMPQSCAADDPVRLGRMPPCVPGLSEPAAVQRMIDAQAIVAHARGLGLGVRFLQLCAPADFARAAALARDARVGVVVPWHTLFDEHARELVAALSQGAAPAVYPSARHVAAGGTLALEPLRDGGRYRASVLALMQVLDGRDPAGLPVLAPRGYEIALNAGAAARQGLQPSLHLLRRADRILP